MRFTILAEVFLRTRGMCNYIEDSGRLLISQRRTLTYYLTYFGENYTEMKKKWTGGAGDGGRRTYLVPLLEKKIHRESSTGRARLIRSHSSARFCFKLSRNLN